MPTIDQEQADGVVPPEIFVEDAAGPGIPSIFTGVGGPVFSVFGRTGAVVAKVGDYNAAQVTNAVDQTWTYADPSWITSLSFAKVTGFQLENLA